MHKPFKFDSFAEGFRFPLFAVARKLMKSVTDVAPKLGKTKYVEIEQIVAELQDEAAVPRCQRCLEKMSPQFYEEKITWWTCDPCADESDREFSQSYEFKNLQN